MSTVKITRPRHPFEGQPLQVLGSMRRHGTRELLVVLPDGSKRLAPVSWTDAGPRGQRAGRGRAGDAGRDGRPAGPVGAGFSSFRPERG